MPEQTVNCSFGTKTESKPPEERDCGFVVNKASPAVEAKPEATADEEAEEIETPPKRKR